MEQDRSSDLFREMASACEAPVNSHEPVLAKDRVESCQVVGGKNRAVGLNLNESFLKRVLLCPGQNESLGLVKLSRG